MEKNKKVLSVLSTAAVAGLIVAAVSTPASAQATAIDINDKAGKQFEYQYQDLKDSAKDAALDSTSTGAALYNDFIARKASLAGYYDSVTKGHVSMDTLSQALITGVVKDADTFKTFMEDAKTPTTTMTPDAVTAGTDGKIVVTPYDSSKVVSSVSAITATTNAGTVATLPSTVQVTLGDGTTANAAITWSAAATSAATYATAGTVTVTGTLADYDNYAVSATVTVNAAKLAVQSVSAIDAAHLKVVFNKPVMNGAGSSSAETLANYAINGTALSGSDKVTLSDDQKSATLQLVTSSILTKNTAYTVTVKQTLADTDGNPLSKTDDSKLGLFFTDETKPTVSSVTAKANGDIKITFSENLGSTVPTVVVNGQTVTALAPVDNTVTVPKANLTAASLENGKAYSIIVSGAKDLATNTMDLYNSTFTYNLLTDTVAPTVVSAQVVDEGHVKVTFSEELQGIGSAITKDGTTDNATKIGLTVKKAGATVSGVTATTKDGIVYTLDLTATSADAVFDSTKNETSASLDFNFTGYNDLGNNVGTATTKTVTLTKDATAPTLVKTQYDATNTNVILTFSEPLATATGASIDSALTIVDNKTGKTVTPAGAAATAVTAGDKTVTISNATSALNLANGSYTFYFAKDALKDLALNGGNKMAAFSTVVTVAGDNAVKPTVASAVASSDQITVTYATTTVVGGNVTGSATDPANYKLDGKALPDGTIITLNTGATAAVIQMPAGSIKTSHTGILTVSNVQGTTGGVIDTVDQTVALTDTEHPYGVAATVDANGALVLTFNEDVNGTFDTPTASEVKPVIGDFVITVNGTTVTDGVVSKGDKDTQIKIASPTVSFGTGTITVKTASSTTGADEAGLTLTTDKAIPFSR